MMFVVYKLYLHMCSALPLVSCRHHHVDVLYVVDHTIVIWLKLYSMMEPIAVSSTCFTESLD
jgi:hypothetical protein